MNVFVVVEGASDEAVLRASLPADILGLCDIVVADGRSTLSSIARTLLVRHQRPLAAMIDTDSLDPWVIHDTVTTTEQLLRGVAGSTPVKVIYCVPALEAIFFEAHFDLKRIFPQYDQQFFLMFAKTRPKEALNYLFQNNGGPKSLTQLIDNLVPEDLGKLRSTYPMQDLMAFINEVCQFVAK